MRFSVQRETLLKPLLLTGGVIERKQTLPILSNVLLNVSRNTLTITATDLEVEIIASAPLIDAQDGQATLPARKFGDICRMLPENATLTVEISNGKATLRSGRSRFTLSTLPAVEFPNVETMEEADEFRIPQNTFKALIEQTFFAMAQQDVRYYLNGLLFEAATGVVRAVATDGHRLALCEQDVDINLSEIQQVILPRKGVLELSRFLEDIDDPAAVKVGSNHIRITTQEVCFTSKLIDGRFPDYQRVLPRGGDKVVISDKDSLKQALTRASILSNERYRSVRFELSTGNVRVVASNPEQEEAEEEIPVEYEGESLEIGFNANYVLDAVNAVREKSVKLVLSDANSCCLIEGLTNHDSKYVVMPMRI